MRRHGAKVNRRSRSGCRYRSKNTSRGAPSYSGAGPITLLAKYGKPYFRNPVRKFISSILAVLVLVLSCVPCSDATGSPVSTQMPEALEQAAGGHHDDHDHGVELCTPFCTCACCASTALPVFHSLELKPVPPTAERVFAVYLPHPPTEVFLPIWQPPQLV